jgi:chromodomain-helicase-DNA-binding protein 1
MDEEAVKELMRPVKKHLVCHPTHVKSILLIIQKKLKSGTANLSRDDKIATLKDCLAGIGTQIDEISATKQIETKNGSKWRKHCWVYIPLFCLEEH